MKLIVGAQFQGKLAFAQELTGLGMEYVAYGATCGFDELWSKAIVTEFHVLVKRMVEEQLSVTQQLEELLKFNPDVVLVADEIAYGFTEDALELQWRRQAGEACRMLAAHAEEVYHVVCGIPVQIK